MKNFPQHNLEHYLLFHIPLTMEANIVKKFIALIISFNVLLILVFPVLAQELEYPENKDKQVICPVTTIFLSA